MQFLRWRSLSILSECDSCGHISNDYHEYEGLESDLLQSEKIAGGTK
jgi:hypothetical protein